MGQFLSMQETNKKWPFWWQMQEAIDSFINLFEKHLLRLVIDYELDGKRDVKVFSGIYFENDEDDFIWLTAGHVVDTLEKVLRKDLVRVRALRWFDGLPGAPSFPVHNQGNLEFLSLESIGIDTD